MIKSKPHFSIHSKNGFVLVMTMAIIAIGLLASSYIASWIDNEVEKRQQSPNSTQQVIDDFSTLSTFIYIASTHPVTFDGFAFPARQPLGYTLPLINNEEPNFSSQGNELKIDGQIYQGIGDSFFSIQDEAGLISVNTLTQLQLKKLLLIAGVKNVNSLSLTAKLDDYIDFDSDYRANGGEQKEYSKSHLKSPANHPLRTPQELSSVLNWSDYLGEQQFKKIEPFLKSTPNTSINLNTATRESLLTLGLALQTVNKIISFRNTQSITFSNMDKLIPSGSSFYSDDRFLTLASDSFKVSILSFTQSKSVDYFIDLTPFSSIRPWTVRYSKTRIIKQTQTTNSAISTGKAIFSE